MSQGQGERKMENPGYAHLTHDTRHAVPLVLLELGPIQCAYIFPIFTATGALAMAGSEL